MTLREKAPPEDGRTVAHTAIYTHAVTTPHLKEEQARGLGLSFIRLLLCLLFRAAKQAGWKFIFGPLHTVSQIRSPFSNLRKAVSAFILCMVAKQLKAKTLGCSVSKRWCWVPRSSGRKYPKA